MEGRGLFHRRTTAKLFRPKLKRRRQENWWIRDLGLGAETAKAQKLAIRRRPLQRRMGRKRDRGLGSQSAHPFSRDLNTSPRKLTLVPPRSCSDARKVPVKGTA